MKEILLLNPSKRRKKRRTKKASVKSATRRTRRKTTTAKKTASSVVKKGKTMPKKNTSIKRRVRRNPSKVTRKIARRTAANFAGMNFKKALNDVPLTTLGMFASKWAAKRFGQSATETDPASWNYASYLKGAAGAAIAGLLANMVKRGSGQNVLTGGLSLMAYKLAQNELIPNSTFWSGQLGAVNQRMPGMIETNDEGTPFILGDDNQWYPLEGDDLNRSYNDYGSALVEPGPLGEALVKPGPLGQSSIDQLYAKAFHRR